jgi:4-hydroxybenzoate polyprenyltransferase|tara:strand:+ start:6082 stop:6909 length:828 start_codon:yes stop_codon:yes gene_type:complete
MIEELKLLVKTSRPILWIVLPLLFLGGVFVSGARMTQLVILQLVLLTFPISLLGYGINDIYDYETDKLNKRKGGIEGVKLEKGNNWLVKKTALIMAGLLFLSALLTWNITNIAGMSLLLFFSYFYSAPPLRFKEKPPLDSFSNGIIYLFAPFLLGFSFAGSIIAVPLKVYLMALGVMGFHAFTTIADYTADKEAGQKTFAIVFGKRTAALVAFLILIATFFAVSWSLIPIIFMSFCAIIFVISLIYPSEKLVLKLIKIIYLVFIIAAIPYLNYLI